MSDSDTASEPTKECQPTIPEIDDAIVRKAAGANHAKDVVHLAPEHREDCQHKRAEQGISFRKWKPLSQAPWKFYTFMSLLLMMGMQGLGSVPEHWPKAYGKNVLEEVDLGHS